jgi:uncharacterized protein YqcC (DUF446 family)
MDDDGHTPIPDDPSPPIGGGAYGPQTETLYRLALDHADRLERTLREGGLWPGAPPPGGFVVEGAFGSLSLAPEEWLAWVLIPRVRHIARDRGIFPPRSRTAPWAVRAFDGHPAQRTLIEVLGDLDEWIDGMGRLYQALEGFRSSQSPSDDP